MIRRASSVEGNVQKSPLCHPPNPKGAKTPFSTGKAAAILTRGAYTVYVSPNAAKSGKSVSPKVRQKGENAVGGFFQHSQSCYHSSHANDHTGRSACVL